MPISKAQASARTFDASRIVSTWRLLIRADVAVADAALVPRQAGLILQLAVTILAVPRSRIAGTQCQRSQERARLGRRARRKLTSIVGERGEHGIGPDDVVVDLATDGALRVADDVVVL